jgi:hypothetical protein
MICRRLGLGKEERVGWWGDGEGVGAGWDGLWGCDVRCAATFMALDCGIPSGRVDGLLRWLVRGAH